MLDIPLQSFLLSLATDGIRLSVSDYDRLLLMFRTGGPWTLTRLKHVLTALLAKDEDQQRLIARKFDRAFEMDQETEVPEFDIRQALEALKAGEARPQPVSEPPRPIRKPEQVKSGPAETSRKSRRNTRRWLLLGVLLLIVTGAAIWRFRPQPPLPCPEVDPVVNFDVQPLNSERQKQIVLTNTCAEPLTIETIKLTGEMFRIDPPDLPKTLAVEEQLIILVVFAPTTPGGFLAELDITHNAADRVNTVRLNGVVEAEVTDGDTRLYKDVPYVADLQYTPLKRPGTWRYYAAITATLALIALFYALYLWRLHKGPQDTPPQWDENAPKMFHPGTIGGQPDPWLDEETLNELADSMGYFQSQRPGKRLDVPASIKATIRQGGLPTCDFERRAQIRTLLVLEDAYAEALDWNPVPGELADGMRRYGVPVIYGRFHGSPDIFRTFDGAVYHLEDLEDQRRGILLLLFTDGKVFHRPRNAFALEKLARWPMLAWMELREQRFWDDTLSLARKYGIPVYPALPGGLLQAVRSFLTERGARPHTIDTTFEPAPLPVAGAPSEASLERGLAGALLWAQDCAMLQPMPEGLAHALRRELHPHLPPEQIECLYALPNTTRTESGLRFSDPVLKILRRGFLQRRSNAEQEQVLRLLLEQIEQARPAAPAASLAALSWEALRERVRLELGTDDDLQRFGELLQTPLAQSLSDSLKHYGFAGQPNTIPLRSRPQSQQALHRLRQVQGNPLNIARPLARRHKLIATGLAIVLVLSIGFTALNVLMAPQPRPVLSVGIPARLEIWENETWQIVQPISDIGELGNLKKYPIQGVSRYRLTLYGNGYRTVREFETANNQDVQLIVGAQDARRPCVEEYPQIGLTVESCPGQMFYTARNLTPPERLMTWKDRLGDHAPDRRLLSVGLEFSANPENRSGSPALWPPLFRGALLHTGSADVVYRLQPDNDGLWHTEQAFAQLRADLAPWIREGQLLWWLADPDVKDIPERDIPEFGRIIRLGDGNDAQWVEPLTMLLESSGERVVTEDQIAQALNGNVQAQGDGEPIALVGRPFTITFTAAVEKTRLTFEDVFVLSFMLSGEGLDLRDATPEFPDLQDFDIVQALEPSTSFLITNGRQSSSLTLAYRLSPKKSGTVTIGSAAFTYKDWTYTTEPITIDVITAETGMLTVFMQPASATLQIARPDGSEIRLLEGESTRKGELPAGQWVLSAQADGYEHIEQTIVIAQGEETEVTVTLPPIVWEEPVTGMVFTRIPAGCFQMGQSESEKQQLIAEMGEEDYTSYYTDELPQHEVCLPEFWMGRYEVTNAEYRTWKPDHDSQEFQGHSLNDDRQPVVLVSWEEAKAFLDWLNQQHTKIPAAPEQPFPGGKSYEFRLPSEAEWEYAARAGTNTSRFWGDDPDKACKYASVADDVLKNDEPIQKWLKDQGTDWIYHECSDGYVLTAPVGSFLPNAFGLHDMLGNVWEWNEDPWHATYEGAPADGSVWEEAGEINKRMLRGGSWYNHPGLVRCAFRIRNEPDYRYSVVGFRVVVSSSRTLE